jgi:hypothetical protein
MIKMHPQVCVYKHQSATASEERDDVQASEKAANIEPAKPVNPDRLKQLANTILAATRNPEEGEEKSGSEKGEKFREVLEKLDKMMNFSKNKLTEESEENLPKSEIASNLS